MIIGLTGPICAGKDEVGKLLALRGFQRISLVEELREEARTRGIDLTRKNLQDLGDSLRSQEGIDTLARRVMRKLVSGTSYVIESIRNPGEVEALRSLPDFFLLCVTAPDHLRFERMVTRNREQDPKTIEEFLQVEARDRGIGQASHAQQNEACWKLADGTITNESTLEALDERLRHFLDEQRIAPLQPVHVMTALPSEAAALDLARALLDQRVVACVQILPGRSLFWWNGKIQEVSEWICFMKGRDFAAMERAIKEKHPYEVPEVLQLSTERGSPDYLKWLMRETLA